MKDSTMVKASFWGGIIGAVTGLLGCAFGALSYFGLGPDVVRDTLGGWYHVLFPVLMAAFGFLFGFSVRHIAASRAARKADAERDEEIAAVRRECDEKLRAARAELDREAREERERLEREEEERKIAEREAKRKQARESRIVDGFKHGDPRMKRYIIEMHENGSAEMRDEDFRELGLYEWADYETFESGDWLDMHTYVKASLKSDVREVIDRHGLID